jgi:hypothetical protein
MILRLLSALAALVLVPAIVRGQQDDTRIRVFLDCQNTQCDRNFFITDLPFVLFTQDRLDADVHLLITRIGTAAGGGEYTLSFVGQKRFAARVDTLVTFLPPNTSEDMRRREQARVAKIGLAPFAMRLPHANRYSLRYDAPKDAPAAPKMTTLKDPWNFWVYRVRLNGSGSAESRNSNYEVNANVNASRITEDWKITTNARNEYRASRFQLSSGADRRFVLRSADATVRIVKTVTDHWSVGSNLSTGYSEFRNTQASVAADLSAEYNFSIGVKQRAVSCWQYSRWGIATSTITSPRCSASRRRTGRWPARYWPLSLARRGGTSTAPSATRGSCTTTTRTVSAQMAGPTSGSPAVCRSSCAATPRRSTISSFWPAGI